MQAARRAEVFGTLTLKVSEFKVRAACLLTLLYLHLEEIL